MPCGEEKTSHVCEFAWRRMIQHNIASFFTLSSKVAVKCCRRSASISSGCYICGALPSLPACQDGNMDPTTKKHGTIPEDSGQELRKPDRRASESTAPRSQETVIFGVYLRG